MFDYPLPKPKNTVYEKIGVAPEYTPEEIDTAQKELLNTIKGQKRQIERRLNKVESQLPELVEVRKKIESLTKEEQSTKRKELNDARLRLVRLESEAVHLDSKYHNIRKMLAKVEEQNNEITNIHISNPEKKLEYDLSTPPCALIRLTQQQHPLFIDRRVAIFFIRRDLSAYLGENGGSDCYHPSDHTRTNFTSDYVYNKHIDGE